MFCSLLGTAVTHHSLMQPSQTISTALQAPQPGNRDVARRKRRGRTLCSEAAVEDGSQI